MAAAKPASITTVAAAAANTTTVANGPAHEQLLEVAEDEVVIDFRPNSKCRADLRLRSLHPSLPVAFKVQTSSPLKFLVSPPRGTVQPLSSASLRVVLRPQPHAPPSFPRSRADRFLVLSSLSAAQLDSTASLNSANAIRLRVFFGGPYLLHLAADAGDAAAVRLILRRQPHLLPLLEPEAAVPDAEHWAPLHAAAARGDCAEVRRLGPEALAARDRDGKTVLHVAAAAGEAEAVAALVDMGADTTAADARGRTPLDVAREKDYKSSGSVVPMVLVINKVDCAPFVSGEQFGRFSGLFRKHVQTCAVTGKGISELEKAVIEVRGLEPVPSGGRWTVNQVTFFMLRNPMCFC